MKIAMAQINPIIGDMEGNTKKIINIINGHKNSLSLDFLVFPETCITGYPPMDLLEREGFIQEQNEYLEKIKKATKIGTFDKEFNVVVGAYSKNEGNGKPLHNSLYVFRNGITILKYDKVCLPTYNIFDELRHCEPGEVGQNNVIVWGTKRIGFLICEDALSSKREDGGNSLYKYDPVEGTFNNHGDFDFLISINASPSNIGKFQLRERIFKRICKEHSIYCIYVNQIGAHDEIVFDGQSFIMNPEGKIIGIMDALKETVETIDTDECIKMALPSKMNYCKEKLYYDHAITGISDFFYKQGFTSAVVGSSGGIDSAVVLALAVDALGAENVKAITMPTKISSAGSVDDSKTLCENLGVELYEYPIGDLYTETVDKFTNIFGAPKGPVTKQNIQPKLRTIALMAYSNEFGHLFLNTSNKTELTFGYGTMYGDLGGAVSPLGDIWKMDVFALAKYINNLHGEEIIPEIIINKKPSAELEENQFDENDLGAYDIADAVGKLYIEQSMLSDEERILCQLTLREKSNKESVLKLVKRIDRNEHKRKQFGVIIRMRGKAFGYGRRMPIVQKHDNTNHPLLDIF